jgi:hypothetical protein
VIVRLRTRSDGEQAFKCWYLPTVVLIVDAWLASRPSVHVAPELGKRRIEPIEVVVQLGFGIPIAGFEDRRFPFRHCHSGLWVRDTLAVSSPMGHDRDVRKNRRLSAQRRL